MAAVQTLSNVRADEPNPSECTYSPAPHSALQLTSATSARHDAKMYHVVFLARILFLGESRIISLIELSVSAFGSVGVL